jgi:hypothetical protein
MTQTKKQQLIDKPIDFASDEHFLQTFYSEKLEMFCCMFNAKLYTYKTWNAFAKKRQYFIDKYNLIECI